MSFHEVLFPTALSYRSLVGQGFKTEIIRTDSGHEHRVAKRSAPRFTYDVAQSLQSDADLLTLREFYLSRNGLANGFRFLDPLDNTTAADGKSAADDEDQTLGTGDGSKVNFQLVKTYTSGAQSLTKNLTKPVSGTTVVALDTVAKTEGVDFTVNTTTGIVTMNSAPGVGVVVTAGCQFHVPVRFGDEIDEDFFFDLQAFDAGEVRVPLVEILDEESVQTDYWFGGSKEHNPMTANVTASLLDGRVIVLNPDASGRQLILPATADMPDGGVHFYAFNDSGTDTVVVKDDGLNTVGTLATNGSAIIVLAKKADNSDAWYMLT